MIVNELKKILLDCNITMTELANALSKKLNKPYSPQNLSNKLHNETIKYKEMQIIADLIGYKVEFVKKGNRS